VSSSEYLEFVSLIPDTNVPLTADVEITSDHSMSVSDDIICGLPLPESVPCSLENTVDVSDVEATLDSSEISQFSPRNAAVISSEARCVPVLNKRSLSFRQRAEEDPDAIHLVPHLEGVDQSDDESESHDKELVAAADQMACQHYAMIPANQNDRAPANDCTTKTGYEMTNLLNYRSSTDKKCRTINNEQFEQNAVKVERVEQVDDMFASHLQKIEEDENDYCLNPKLYNMFPTVSGICEDSMEDKPLFAMSMLLKDAGLSPQYLKAGPNHFGASSMTTRFI
jgi:hypothetical protein